MEKDNIPLSFSVQMKFCRYFLRAITKLMLLHFFKAEELQRPKNLANLLSKAGEYLRLWHHFLTQIFENSHKSAKKHESAEDFEENEVPMMLLRRKFLAFSKRNPTNLQSPRLESRFSVIDSFSERVKSEENDEKHKENDLETLDKFQRNFYFKEFVGFLLKLSVCWCVYFQK